MKKYALYSDRLSCFVETDDVELVVYLAERLHCMFMQVSIGARFEWNAEHITGNKSVTEIIIGFTDDGFLHTSHHCPVYETKWEHMYTGRLIKEA